MGKKMKIRIKIYIIWSCDFESSHCTLASLTKDIFSSLKSSSCDEGGTALANLILCSQDKEYKNCSYCNDKP